MAKSKTGCVWDIAGASLTGVSKRSLRECDAAWDKTREAMTNYLREYLKHNAMHPYEFYVVNEKFSKECDRPPEVVALSLSKRHWGVLCTSVMQAIRRTQLRSKKKDDTFFARDGLERYFYEINPVPPPKRRHTRMLIAASLTDEAVQPRMTSPTPPTDVFDSEIQTTDIEIADSAVQMIAVVMKDASTHMDCYCVNCKKFHFCQ